MKITIKEIMETWETMDDEKRNKIGAVLFPDVLCHHSVDDMYNYQKKFKIGELATEKGFKEFRKGQCEVLKGCIEIEVSDLGTSVRGELGMKPLSLEDEIEF